jgi:hypothetical protein
MRVDDVNLHSFLKCLLSNISSSSDMMDATANIYIFKFTHITHHTQLFFSICLFGFLFSKKIKDLKKCIISQLFYYFLNKQFLIKKKFFVLKLFLLKYFIFRLLVEILYYIYIAHDDEDKWLCSRTDYVMISTSRR